MDLAKDCIDVGLMTNHLDEMRAFYAERIGLPYEELLPVGGGVKQYRYGLLGSVLKINHSRDPLPARIAGGYSRLSIAHGDATGVTSLSDPDGNQIELVPSGYLGVNQIGIHLGVTNEADFDRFYGEVLGGEKLGPKRYRIGKTVLSFERDANATRADRSDPRSPAEVMSSMRAVGFRYITIQVRDCSATFKHAMAHGAWEGSAPVTLGEVARICFIRDPDGNWIEISQRASLTGPLPKE
jgi:catechol 2,3-dioxygenase-like lactoylglutathione lyase family enzyme